MAEEKLQHEAPHDGPDSSPKLVEELAYGMLESLLNAAIEHDPLLLAEVKQHSGLVVRIKTTDPQLTAYLVFTEHGIEISTRRSHSAQVRINGSLLSLISVLLGQRDLDDDRRIRLWGDSEAIAWLIGFAHDINARTALQRWLREHVNITELWQKIRRNDLSWLSDLMPMPAMLREALGEIRALKKQLQAQEDLYKQQQDHWQAQRRWDVWAALVILGAVLVAALPGDSLPEQVQALSDAQIIAIGLGVAALLLRGWRQ